MSTFLTSEKRSVPGVRKENSLLQHQTTIVEFILLSQLFLRLRKTSTLIFFECESNERKIDNVACFYATFCLLSMGFSILVVQGEIMNPLQVAVQYNVKKLLTQGRRQVAQSNSTRQVLKRDQQLPKLDDFDN